MNRRQLGRIDLHVSELCLGTLSFGWHTNEATAFEILDGFLKAGGNFIQTCGVGSDAAYGAASTRVSESYVGRWLKARGIPRGDVVIASRQAMIPTDGRDDTFRVASRIRRNCEESLRRLRLRYLDLLVFEWNEGAPMEETLLAAAILVRAGMIRHVAVSGFPAWRAMEWIGHAARRNLGRPEVLQNEFSLVSNSGGNKETLGVAREYRLGFLARAPLAGGFLAGRFMSLDTPDSGRAQLIRQRFSSAVADAARAEVRAISRAVGASDAQVALAWALVHPGVSAALVGVNAAAQLDDLVGATALALSRSDLQRLDRRWKTIGGDPPYGDLHDHFPEGFREPAALQLVENATSNSHA